VPKIQLIACYVDLGGDRNNVAFRGPDNPVTFPEALVLQAIHGGADHVHTLVDVGAVERDMAEEFERLASTYGELVHRLFPSAAGRPALPLGDDTIPTLDAVEAADAAAAAALEAAKSKRQPRRKADTDTVPGLNELPGA
jgi:hypothetical protein